MDTVLNAKNIKSTATMKTRNLPAKGYRSTATWLKNHTNDAQ